MHEDCGNELAMEKLRTVLTLEWLGIHIEDKKETVSKGGVPGKTIYFFSVPESSTIEVDDMELNEKVKTSDGLIAIAKEVILDMLVTSCEELLVEDEEFLSEIKNNTSDYFKLYAKVRTGEKWNKELGDATVQKLTEAINATSAYKENSADGSKNS